MVHLLPLPGAPGYQGSIDAIYQRAAADLHALEKGGADAAIIENFSDIPYSTQPGMFPLITMASLAGRLRSLTQLPLGINVQYNCAEAEWAIACAAQCDFIRVECFVEARAGVHGTAQPAAPLLARLRQTCPAPAMVFADINTKHTFPLVEQPLEFSIAEAIASAADALIITGLATGQNPNLADVKAFKALAGDTPVLLGSGVKDTNASDFFSVADGAIVGSWVKENGQVEKPVDENRVRAFVSAAGY